MTERAEGQPTPNQQVVIIMGSESDLDHCQKIGSKLDEFGVSHTMRVASAHKTPELLLQIINEYNDTAGVQTVFIAVAGRSNALGGFIDFQTQFPVINSPPYSEKYAGADIYSSLRMPSGSASTTVIEPEASALAAVKIFGLSNPMLAEKLRKFQSEQKKRVYNADEKINP